MKKKCKFSFQYGRQCVCVKFLIFIWGYWKSITPPTFWVFFYAMQKKDTGKCQAYWRCFCYRKRDYPEYPKRPQIFHRRGFLVTQINTEYSEDISQLRLENDWEQKFQVFFCENEKLTHILLPYNIFFKKKRGWAYISV